MTRASSTWLHTLLVIMGRNDVSLDSKGVDSSVTAYVVGTYQKVIDNMAVQNKVFVILWTINRMLTERFPAHFIDIRSDLVNQVIYDLEITPTEAGLGNIAIDCPPPSVMVDVTHVTDEESAMISKKLLKPWLIGKGHYTL